MQTLRILSHEPGCDLHIDIQISLRELIKPCTTYLFEARGEGAEFKTRLERFEKRKNELGGLCVLKSKMRIS